MAVSRLALVAAVALLAACKPAPPPAEPAPAPQTAEAPAADAMAPPVEGEPGRAAAASSADNVDIILKGSDDETPSEGASAGAPPVDRGLPVCPGDPRCKKK